MSRNYSFRIIEHTMIELPDGTSLSARIWMPEPESDAKQASDDTFPAVLEYLPYRKRDGTAPRDESTYPVFARSGIVGVRVDLTGHGESDGEFDDEYSPRELKQGVAVIEWIAKQTWCNGNVGMMGISWGGFNGMQIAAMNPPALKAVVSVGTTVDRYNDDIHYKNGCHLYSDFYWSNTMMTYSARPPDPLLRNDWQAQWKHRLENLPFPLHIWLSHQRRDDYWKHGSVCEDYANYTIPTLIIGGWSDLYQNAPPELTANASGVVKAINGPWIHKYPHFALPKPRMDFHAETINWWNHWLRNESVYPQDTPDYRVFMSENVRAGGIRMQEEGRWMAMDQWPCAEKVLTYFPTAQGQLLTDTDHSTEEQSVTICSPVDCGTACGEMFSLAPDSDLPADQRMDDAGSLVFRTDVLEEAIEIIGRPRFKCTLSIDKPLGNLCVRLIDKHPDGNAHRVSWGVLNLAHRNGNENPQVMRPDINEAVVIELDHCAYKFIPGHKLQLSVSTNYWPAIQPPPEQITATIVMGSETALDLPMPESAIPVVVPEPDNPNPLPDYKILEPSQRKRWVEQDLQSGCTSYHVFDDTGEEEIPDHKLVTRHIRDESWTIETDKPLSATAQGKHTWISRRDNWDVKIECDSSMHCDAKNFYIIASVTTWLNDERFHKKTWQETIERDYI